MRGRTRFASHDRYAFGAVAEAPGYVHVAWDAVDTWVEEGRALVHYPPNPYHRVDCRPGRLTFS